MFELRLAANPTPDQPNNTFANYGYYHYPVVAAPMNLSPINKEYGRRLGVKVMPGMVKDHFRPMLAPHGTDVEAEMDAYVLGAARKFLLWYRTNTTLMQDINFAPVEPLDIRLAANIRDTIFAEAAINPSYPLDQLATSICMFSFWHMVSNLLPTTDLRVLSNRYNYDIASAVAMHRAWLDKVKHLRVISAADAYIHALKHAQAAQGRPKRNFDSNANGGNGGFVSDTPGFPTNEVNKQMNNPFGNGFNGQQNFGGFGGQPQQGFNNQQFNTNLTQLEMMRQQLEFQRQALDQSLQDLNRQAIVNQQQQAWGEFGGVSNFTNNNGANMQQPVVTNTSDGGFTTTGVNMGLGPEHGFGNTPQPGFSNNNTAPAYGTVKLEQGFGNVPPQSFGGYNLTQQQQYGGNNNQQQQSYGGTNNQQQFGGVSNIQQPSFTANSTEFNGAPSGATFDNGFGDINPSPKAKEETPSWASETPKEKMSPLDYWNAYGYSELSNNPILTEAGYVPGRYPRSVTEIPSPSGTPRHEAESRFIALIEGKLMGSSQCVADDGYSKTPLQINAFGSNTVQVTKASPKLVADSLRALNTEDYRIMSKIQGREVFRSRDTVLHSNTLARIVALGLDLTEEILVDVDDMRAVKGMSSTEIIKHYFPNVETKKDDAIDDIFKSEVSDDPFANIPVNDTLPKYKVTPYKEGIDLTVLNHTNERITFTGCTVSDVTGAFASKRPYGLDDYEIWSIRFDSFWSTFRACKDFDKVQITRAKLIRSMANMGENNFNSAKLTVKQGGETVYISATGDLIKGIELDKLEVSRNQWFSKDDRYHARVAEAQVMSSTYEMTEEEAYELEKANLFINSHHTSDDDLEEEVKVEEKEEFKSPFDARKLMEIALNEENDEEIPPRLDPLEARRRYFAKKGIPDPTIGPNGEYVPQQAIISTTYIPSDEPDTRDRSALFADHEPSEAERAFMLARAEQRAAVAEAELERLRILDERRKAAVENPAAKLHNQYPDTEVYTAEQLEQARLVEEEAQRAAKLAIDNINKGLAYRQSLGGEPCPVPVGHPPREGYPGQPNDFTDMVEHPEAAAMKVPATEVKPATYSYGAGVTSMDMAMGNYQMPTVDEDPVLPSNIPTPEPISPTMVQDDDFESFFAEPDLTNIPSHPTDKELTVEYLDAKKAEEEKLINDSIPEELKNASYEEIMDAARAEGHVIEDPKDKPFRMDWGKLPLEQRKMITADVGTRSPAFDPRKEKVVISRGEDGKLIYEVVELMDEEKHVIRGYDWSVGFQEKSEADALLRVIGSGSGSAAFDQYIEELKAEIDKLREDAPVLVLEASMRTPLIEIEEPMVTTSSGNEYQSEVERTLVAKDMDPDEISSILETNTIKYERFITSGAQLTQSTEEFVDAIMTETTARSLIVAINDFRGEAKLSRREIARLIKDFNRILSNHITMIIGPGYKVNDYASDYQTILAESLLNLSNTHTDQEINELLDKAYLCAARECFNTTEINGGSDGTEVITVVGRTETIVLLPIYSEFCNIANTDGEASVITRERHGELRAVLDRIMHEGEYGTFRMVTLDNVAWTVMSDEENIYLLDIKE